VLSYPEFVYFFWFLCSLMLLLCFLSILEILRESARVGKVRVRSGEEEEEMRRR
jgi:lipopolysaccharide export LptBFGC system permease protein LptF